MSHRVTAVDLLMPLVFFSGARGKVLLTEDVIIFGSFFGILYLQKTLNNYEK